MPNGRVASVLVAAFALALAAPASAQPYPPYSPPPGPVPCGGPGYPCPSPGYGLPTQPPVRNPYSGAYSPPPYQPPQPYQPPAPPPPPRPSYDDDRSGLLDDSSDGNAALFLDLVSIRVGTYDIRGSDADARTWGFLFALDPDLILTADYFTLRSTWFAAIGGGSDGLEGQLENSETFGVRGYFGDDHGPFARLGFAYQLMGNNKLYRSYVELPRVEVGYQLLSASALFEVAARGGLVLGGRYYTGDHAERRIDSEPAWGAIATLQIPPVRVHASAMRIEARQTGPGTPIDQVDSSVCLNPWKGLLLCGHASLHRGDVELPGGGFRESTATYFGGTLGYGCME